MTMLTESGTRTRSHGLPVAVVEAQAAAIGVPLLTASATWSGYEGAFDGMLRAARVRGIEDAVFGDIDLDDHRAWEERVCAAAAMRCHLPLWRTPRRALLDEWWEQGFSAMIVAVKHGALPESMLGQQLDRAVVDEIEGHGADCCGEGGEYHTVVTDGPLFRHPIHLAVRDSVLRDGVWFADVALANSAP